MRKVKVISKLLSSPYELATVSHSRYQSTLWSATVPQLCSYRPQARASQATIQRIRLGRIFAGSSRIINENLSYRSYQFSPRNLVFRNRDTPLLLARLTLKLFILAVNLVPLMPSRNTLAQRDGV